MANYLSPSLPKLHRIDTITIRKRLSSGTVPVNKKNSTVTLPANKENLTGTAPVNKEHLTCTLYIFWEKEVEMLIEIP